MTNQPKNTSGAKPAVPHKKNFLDDRRIRLALSILGAIVAWMIVTIIVQPGTTNTIYNVPVDYTYDSSVYTSRGLSIVSAEDKTVNLWSTRTGPACATAAKRPCACWCGGPTACSMASP